MGRLLGFLMRRRRAGAVSILLLLSGALAVGMVGQAERDPSPTDGLPRDTQSTKVVELQDELPSGDDSTAIVLFASDDELDRQTLDALQERFAEVSAQIGRDGEGPPPELIPSEDGTAAFGVVSVPGTGASQVADQVRDLREAVRADLPTGMEALVTGPAAIQADLAAVFDGANFRLLAATASVVAVLLIITYRSPWLWLVPIVVVGIGDQAAAVLATHVLEATGTAWDESTVGILSVLVFGVATDYALLLISRYRDELRVHEDRYVAMARAARRTVEPVVASATTVVLGLLTLLLSLFPTTRGLGLACAVGIVVAAFSSLVALPFTLVVFGRWIFWPKVPRVGDTTLVESRTLWTRIGDLVGRRPVTLIAVTLLFIGSLGAGATQLQTGLATDEQFLETPEAITASQRLAESFPAGSADPTIVITEAGDAALGAVEQVEGVSEARVVQEDGQLTRIDAVLQAEPGSAEARATVERLRSAVSDVDATYVGGTEAQSIDERSAAERDRMLLIPLILGLVIVGLMVLLRSIVAPLLLVASVVASYFAALGASWLLFTEVLGFDNLDSSVPLLAFLFLVALGVDYNIFLVTRASEESEEHGTRQGMLRALNATGGVITSAGVLLAAVFAVLGVLPLVVLAQIGVVVCIGVLLDTLVVRTVLVPSIAVRMGPAFWWPRRFAATY